MVEIYFQVGFVLGIVSMSIQVLRIVFSSYPRTQEHGIKGDMFTFLVSIGFFVWLCIIKFTVLV